MNIQKIYSESIGRKPKEDSVVHSLSPEADAARLQARMNWLESTITQEIFRDLQNKVVELETQARQLACSYHQHNNHQQIIALLIRADEARKVIDTYASAK
jgi:uncharacterized coiled-coil DUF342 family protein